MSLRSTQIIQLAAKQARVSAWALTPLPAPMASGPSRSLAPAAIWGRSIHSTPSWSKKASKASASSSSSSKSAKLSSRDEVENIDYEDPKLDATLGKVRDKMEKAVDWARTVVWEGVERGRGRVSPALLDSVKVSIPDQGIIPLNTVASVTVKASTLYVDVWDTSATKHVETALHKANLPGMSPQKVDAGTLKIPVSRPTGDQRAQILKSLGTTIESAKNTVRQARNDGLKSVGGKDTQGGKDVQKSADEFGKALDDMISTAKKEFEKA